MRNKLISILILSTLLIIGTFGLIYWRQSHCQYVPWFSPELLPNSDFSIYSDIKQLPPGWSGRRGAQLCHLNAGCQGFSLTGHSILLFGIANYIETPSIDILPGQNYCFTSKALTNSKQNSATRIQVIFQWLNSTGQVVNQHASVWQEVVLWQPDKQPRDWSQINAAFLAPLQAAKLRIRLHTSSDDPVFLDMISVKPTIKSTDQIIEQKPTSPLINVNPWPGDTQAALSFSFDWESTMGGLIHSRSLDDPNNNQDPILRGLRMREGITTTLAIFRPHNIQATYYATGYNFLLGNIERRTFMNNPTFDWANENNRWKDNTWQKNPWFSLDPYGTYLSDPAWYFGDLIPILQQSHQDIQTHTFSHLYGGLASSKQWHDDLEAWQTIAAERGIPPAKSLAFPWSSSAGMSDNNWNELEKAGITSVTRTAWSLDQFDLFDRNKETGFIEHPNCKQIPGHETILACPDLPLTTQNVSLAIKQIDTAIANKGMVDLWAHTEEVTSDDQIAAWRKVVEYAIHQRDNNLLWIAPLSEITSWQQALAKLQIQGPNSSSTSKEHTMVFTIQNQSDTPLRNVTLEFPFTPKQILISGKLWHLAPKRTNAIQINLGAGQTIEIAVSIE